MFIDSLTDCVSSALILCIFSPPQSFTQCITYTQAKTLRGEKMLLPRYIFIGGGQSPPPGSTPLPSGVLPRPLSRFLHILGHRTLLVARKIRFSCPKYKEKVKKSGGDSHHHFQKWWWQVTIVTYKVVLHNHSHARLTALFLGVPGWAGTRKVKPIWGPVYKISYDLYRESYLRKALHP